MARFLFAACQPGSEAALKADVARRSPGPRFAFSRPGFVTFSVTEEASPTLRSPFARTWGHSLGKVTGADEAELARPLWTLIATRLEAEELARVKSALARIYEVTQHANHDIADAGDWSIVEGEAQTALNVFHEVEDGR